MFNVNYNLVMSIVGIVEDSGTEKSLPRRVTPGRSRIALPIRHFC